METSLQRTERAYLKLIIGCFVGLVVFIALCWAGFHFYRQWEEAHLVRRAAAYKSGGDLKTASLNARRALQLNPRNVDATRLIAELAEKTGDRTAIDWRRKVLELNPGSIDDALALVRSALWIRDFATAAKTLESIEARAETQPEFQAASGRFAEMRKDLGAAEAHWTKATELAPNDKDYRFQLALLQIGMGDATKRAEALRVLEELRGDAKERAAATRTLIIDGVAHHVDPKISRDLAAELQSYPEASFSDHILYLEILRQLKDPAYADYLARLKKEVPAKGSDLAALISWMVRNKMLQEAIDYAGSVSAEERGKWPVPLAIADAYAQAKDWVTLERVAKESNWAGYDFLRRAFLARALRGEGKELAADQELSAAQKEAASNTAMLSMLTQTIADWGWQDDAIELLWSLTKAPETRMDALQTLYDHYTKVSDTSGIFRTLSKFAEINPNDRPLQNNLAQISLLLGVDVEHARKEAAELAAEEPGNPGFVSTYAFALMSKGDIKGALQAMRTLTDAQLNEPSIATYYGLVLAAAGEKEKAREYLQRSAQASLLPEEKTLVEKAESSLN
ncbi:MAG: hypothetical protein M3Y86_07215 [Verrucomicrobiota bacterium]|nr:hypothetical protein [Verrucomicrobiota bacterium]